MTPRDEWQLDTQGIGRRVLVFDRLDSTSTFAASLAHDPASDGLAILADEQTAGRGRLGRKWLCPPSAGVLLTVLLFPPAGLCRSSVLTAWAAVSVCEAIRRLTHLHARVKWPNDVHIQGRKVCGILLERRGTATLCGIGLNLSQPPMYFVEADLPHAGSLGMFTSTPPRRDEAARVLLEQLDEEYGRLLSGDLATLESCWKRRIGLLGKRVAVACFDTVYYGRLRELTWERIELETDVGHVLWLRPEVVQQIAVLP